MIDFKEGAVCYADGKQWMVNTGKYGYDFAAISDVDYCNLKFTLELKDFQLNEPKEGYYILKSELDTEEKYNQAVEVFGLSGFKDELGRKRRFDDYNSEYLVIYRGNVGSGKLDTNVPLLTKLNLDQLIAIGELKRKMNERENEFIESRELDVEMIKRVTGVESKPAKKRKSKEAYRILESMGIEWDNVKGKWFKKEWL